ncbi:type II secretion system protein [Vibrio comitans]|uniref:Type IV pilin n=1 Tax=Vibrio comitans NBRC 102076 TaxID=1219078 RepID=A0A4Y3ITH4_9VIBR|nr:type II secretion system protein [Vibrio comitans]GEA62385.1 type IV pilin [Vibrio comitans NBRC 102076]
MKKTIKGFTLIELVAVLILITIIAVVAAPKFINLSSDARTNTMKMVAAAMRASADQVKFQAQIQGVQNGDVELESIGRTVVVYSGHVKGHWRDAWQHILDIGKVIEWTNVRQTCTKHDICGVGNQTGYNIPSFPHPEDLSGQRGLVLVWPEGYQIADLCYSYYYNPQNGEEPIIGTVVDGC